MFDIGFWEILLILVLALVVLGPERLPQVARSVGYWIGKGRRYIEGVKNQVESEFDTSEVKRLLHNQEVQIKELQSKLDSSAEEAYTNDLDEADELEVHHDHEEPEYELLEDDDDSIEAISKKHGIDMPKETLAEEISLVAPSTGKTE